MLNGVVTIACPTRAAGMLNLDGRSGPIVNTPRTERRSSAALDGPHQRAYSLGVPLSNCSDHDA